MGLRLPDPAGVDQVRQSIAWWAHREHASSEDNDPRRPTVRRAFVAIDVAHESASGIIVRRLGGKFVRGEALESCPKVDRSPDRSEMPCNGVVWSFEATSVKPAAFRLVVDLRGELSQSLAWPSPRCLVERHRSPGPPSGELGP